MFDDVLGDSALKVPNSEGQWNAEHCDGTRAGLCWVTNCSGIRLSRTPLRYSTPTLPFPLYSPAIHCVIPSLWKFPTFLHRFTMASIVWGCVLDGIHHQGAERATLSRDLGLGHMLPPATLVMLLACFQRLCHVFFAVIYVSLQWILNRHYAMLHMWTSIQHWQVSVFHLTKSFSTCWNTIIFKKITSLTHPSQVGVSADLQYFEISNFIKAAGIIMQHPTTVSSKPKGKHGHLHLKIRIQDITMILITWVFQR